ncbi:MAG: hypothetical protein IJ573_07660 [Clostridia bacterium]|nr:hypothetical protein [Clostridia bacterium]
MSRKDRTVTAFLALSAFVLVALCSMSSPLYPLNIWGDANCLLTVGRTMKSGAVLYRDIYEQKGPTLYLAHMLAAFVSEKSFLGVYLMEGLGFTAFLLAAERLLRRRLKQLSPALAVLCGALILVSGTFVRGDSAEEFCLPLAMAALCLADGEALTGRAPMSRRALFGIGVLAGAVATVKFTLLGVFLGLCLAEGVSALSKGGLSRALASAACFLAGFFIPVLLWALYFAANGALKDALAAYVVNNIFCYAGEGRFGAADWIAFLKSSGWWAVPALAGVLAFAADRREGAAARLGVLAGFAIQLLAVVLPGRVWQYSLMALAPYTVYGALWAGRLLEEKLAVCLSGRSGAAAGIAALLSLALGVFATPNAFLRGVPAGELAQYRLAAMIEPGSSLLQYKFLDDGLYLTSGILPQEKYFVLLNVDLPEMKRELDRAVEEGEPDYVLTVYDALPERFARYRLIATDVGYLDNNKPNKEFYLYRRMAE